MTTFTLKPKKPPVSFPKHCTNTLLSLIDTVFLTTKPFLELCPNLIVWLTSGNVQTVTDSHFRHYHVCPVHEKVQKLFESRAKAEDDLNKIQKEVTEAVSNAERRVRIERLVTYCEEAMTIAFSKTEQLLELAKKTSDPASVKADLEKWLNDTTVLNDEIL